MDIKRKNIKLFIPLFFLFVANPGFAQEQLDTGKIVQKLLERRANAIALFEGFPAIPFQAPDTEGHLHLLEHFRGQILILQFWDIVSQPCLDQIPGLNRLVETYEDRGVAVLGFVNEYGSDLQQFLERNEVQYPVIPNSADFGREAYGGHLGIPRLFVIDQYGTVQKVILGGGPPKENDLGTFYELEGIVEKLLKS